VHTERNTARVGHQHSPPHNRNRSTGSPFWPKTWITERRGPHPAVAPSCDAALEMAVLNNRILVVEDEDVIRLVLSALLAEKGYAMTCASTGSEALSLAPHENYAVALVGMLVP